jgi:hypothetical protein
VARRRPFLVLSLVAASALAAAGGRGGIQPLPDPGRLPASSIAAARPFLADFILTRRAGSCPGMTARMALLDEGLTAGPDHDTPEFLATDGFHPATMEVPADPGQGRAAPERLESDALRLLDSGQ